MSSDGLQSSTLKSQAASTFDPASLASLSRKSLSALSKRAARNTSDDTLATARSLGTFTGGQLSLGRRDTLNRTDRVDIFSLTLPNGVTLPASVFRFKIQQGRVRYSLLGGAPSFGIPPQENFSQVIKGSGQINAPSFSNTFGVPLVVYFRFQRLGKKPTKYNFRVTSS